MDINIAIADDHRLVRETFADLLTDLGYCISLQVENGAALLQNIDPRNLPHICIVDIDMPVMTGFETSRIIKAKWPSIKMLIYSFRDDLFTLRHANASGADAFILKTASLDDFQRILEKLATDIERNIRGF